MSAGSGGGGHTTARQDRLSLALCAFVDRFQAMPIDDSEARLRRQVMEVTLQIAAAEGVKGASLRRIAARTGMRTASLYTIFPGGKDELVSTALAEHLRGFYRTAAAALRVDDTPAENLRRLVFAHVRWTLENPTIAPAILILERAHEMLPIMTGHAARSIHELHDTYGVLLEELLAATGATADVHRYRRLVVVVADHTDTWLGSGTVEEAQEFAWLAVRRMLGWGAVPRTEQRHGAGPRQRKAASPVNA